MKVRLVWAIFGFSYAAATFRFAVEPSAPRQTTASATSIRKLGE
jgi:hypothetical protein